MLNNPLGLLIYTSGFCFKLENFLYGLKYAPRVWYERLSSFLVDKDFIKIK